MENVTVRMESDLLDEIDGNAEESGMNRSEYIRHTLATRNDLLHRLDELEQQIDQLEAKRDDLRRQLREANRRQREVGELANYVERERRLDRERREANALQRARWFLFGYDPDEE